MTNLTEPEKIPPEDYRQKIEKLAKQISDPVRKLKFLHQALDDFHKHQSLKSKEDLQHVLQATEFDSLQISENSNFWAAEESETQSILDLPTTGNWRQNFFYLIAIMGILVSALTLFMVLNNRNTISSIVDKTESHPKTYVLQYVNPTGTDELKVEADLSIQETKVFTEKKAEIPEYLDTLIWMIEIKDHIEYYSNRLQIDTSQTIENLPRQYHKIPLDAKEVLDTGVKTDQVAGIIYHAAESDIYAFKPEMTQSIKEYSRLLIQYLKKKKAYHYFIDRFGNVYRLVQEDHMAFHAGNSIWTDSDSIYMDLNSAFIGICFEGKDFEHTDLTESNMNGKSNGPKMISMDKSSINKAQLRSGKELTDWLRVKYHIRQQNCVPHALVSVNPYDFLIGHHLDLSFDFPFDMFELSNKYNELIPAITEFGFSYNKYFVEVMNGRFWPGIVLSEKNLRQHAEKQKISLKSYRTLLNKRFNKLFKLKKK